MLMEITNCTDMRLKTHMEQRYLVAGIEMLVDRLLRYLSLAQCFETCITPKSMVVQKFNIFRPSSCFTFNHYSLKSFTILHRL